MLKKNSNPKPWNPNPALKLRIAEKNGGFRIRIAIPDKNVSGEVIILVPKVWYTHSRVGKKSQASRLFWIFYFISSNVTKTLGKDFTGQNWTFPLFEDFSKFLENPTFFANPDTFSHWLA